MNSLSVFSFDSNEIRFVGGKPVANDVAVALGYADPQSTISKKVQPKNKGVAKMETPGGTQSVTVLEESGIYQLIFGSKLDQAEKFQDWVFDEVLPSIRKTGTYCKDKPVTANEILLAQSEVILGASKALIEMERRIESVESDVAVIKERAIAAEKELKALPPASKCSPARTTRNNINTLVRGFCHAVGMAHKEAWNNLYREFRDRCHVDLKIRASNGNCKPLDLAETLDVLEDLYAVAQEIFKV